MSRCMSANCFNIIQGKAPAVGKEEAFDYGQPTVCGRISGQFEHMIASHHTPNGLYHDEILRGYVLVDCPNCIRKMKEAGL